MPIQDRITYWQNNVFPSSRMWPNNFHLSVAAKVLQILILVIDSRADGKERKQGASKRGDINDQMRAAHLFSDAIIDEHHFLQRPLLILYREVHQKSLYEVYELIVPIKEGTAQDQDRVFFNHLYDAPEDVRTLVKSVQADQAKQKSTIS
jgi:hypothetical protein